MIEQIAGIGREGAMMRFILNHLTDVLRFPQIPAKIQQSNIYLRSAETREKCELEFIALPESDFHRNRPESDIHSRWSVARALLGMNQSA